MRSPAIAAVFRSVVAFLLLAAAGPSSAETLRTREVIKPPPGPWGSLEYYRIPLDAPEHYLQFLTTPSQQVEWAFPPGSETSLRLLLRETGLTDAEVGAILGGSTILSNSEIMRVFPKDETILEMPYEVRRQLYQLLSRFKENRYHIRPIYIDSENLSNWFAGTSFPRSAIEDISRLAYPTPRERGFFFADTPFTLRRASSTVEEKEILRRLLRKQSLIVRLRLTRDSLTQEIDDYWTADYKNKAVMPLLESVVSAKEGATVDVAHLLPATPRQLLNRFPDPADGIDGRLPDWFWTCYNFFRFVPREVFADSPERSELILSEFVPTLPPLQFGDMLLLNSGAQTVHGCIHIADDIVFTKNGADLFSPWVLMRLEDVIAYHDLYGNISLSVYRRTITDRPDEP